MSKHSEKGDLRLLGEIDKRAAELTGDAKRLVGIVLSLDVTDADIETIRQIVERRSALTAEGKAYADKKLGVDAPVTA